nr:uncharacterized mitochondrial protein AtMg00810-like [Tanacetum cinerariifolium]
MIGSLMYLTASRPDIMFAVSACSRHQATPLTSHLNAVKKIFKYLKRQPNLGLWHPRDSPFQLEAYSDSDYAGSHGDKKSITGGCQFLGGRLISWQCKKQTVVATSSTKDEYIAAASCCGQINAVSYGLLLYFVSNVSGYPKLQVVQDDHNKVAYLEKGKGWEAYEQILDFLNRSHIRYALTHRPTIVFDSLVKQFWATTTVRTLEAGPSDIIATINGYPADGSLTFYKAKLSPQWRFIMDGMIGNIGSKRHKFLMYPRFLQMILGIQTTDPSHRPTFDFTAKLFSNMKLNWDRPHMTLLASMLVVPAGGGGADAVTAGAVAAHDVSPPPIVPPTHSTPGPSSASQVTPVREPTPVRDPTPIRDPTPMREPTPSPVREPTPNFPRPHSPPLRTEKVGPTTSTRPPSPTRHTSVHEDISEGGGDFVSSPQSNEAPQTPAATAAGGAEDSAALTALSLKLDKCLHRVTTLENKLGITKKVLGGAILKLVTRVKRLEGLLQQRKRRLVLSDFEGKDATQTEQDIDLAALHTLASTSLGGDSFAPAAGPDADTTMPFRSKSSTQRRLRNPFSSASAHVSKNIPAGASVPAAATTIPAGSSVDAAIHAAALSSSIPTAADKGKAPMLGEELAKKIHAEQEAEFARQQEELAQKAQAERVACPTEHELLAKIATNSALSKQLLRDDVTKENMNERLGMLLLRKRRELAEQSQVKPMTKTQQRNYMRDFVKNNSASVYNQGWSIKKVKALSIAQLRLDFEYIPQHFERSNLLNFRRSTFRPKPTLVAPSAKRANQGAPQVPAASSQVPAAPSFPADVLIHAATSSAPTDISVLAVSPAHVAVSVPAETVVQTVESHLDDPLTASEHVSTDPTVTGPTPSSSRQRQLAHCSWRLYPRAQVHVLETVDGRVIHMFVDVSYPLTVATLKRMLKHGLDVPKLLVGGDLTMAEQLIGFIKAALLNAQSAV